MMFYSSNYIYIYNYIILITKLNKKSKFKEKLGNKYLSIQKSLQIWVSKKWDV